jgi:undecaprenyl-diphosphatase
MDFLQTMMVAILQGATELFPVSSLGHAVVVPALFDWQLNQRSDAFLPFLVLLHAGTSAALLLYFSRDWLAMAAGLLGLSGQAERAKSRKLFVRIIIATIPAVVFGFVLNKFFKDLFSNPLVACFFLVVNGIMLLGGEQRRRQGGKRPIEDIGNADALIIGFWQVTALFPGISRSGATIVGGLLLGVTHEAAAHFSFLIALPVIVGATVLEVPKMLHAGLAPDVLKLAVEAAVVAGVTAWLSTWFLMRYFRNNDKWAMGPFGIYCMVFGLASFAWLGLMQ